MKRFALTALLLAAIAGNTFAAGTTIFNDKNRPIVTPAPASTPQAEPAVVKPAEPKASTPYALTGDQTSAPVRHYNDKHRPID